MNVSNSTTTFKFEHVATHARPTIHQHVACMNKAGIQRSAKPEDAANLQLDMLMNRLFDALHILPEKRLIEYRAAVAKQY